MSGLGSLFGSLGSLFAHAKSANLPRDPAPTQEPVPGPPIDPTPWMTWLESHIGEIQKTGAKPPTAFNREVFSHTDYGPLEVMDEACAATLCAALEETGYASPHSALAASFDTYGTPCELKYGAIVRFQWPSGGHHVTTCDFIRKDGFVNCLGGNQSGEIKVNTYPVADIVAIRWPVKP